MNAPLARPPIAPAPERPLLCLPEGPSVLLIDLVISDARTVPASTPVRITHRVGRGSLPAGIDAEAVSDAEVVTAGEFTRLVERYIAVDTIVNARGEHFAPHIVRAWYVFDTETGTYWRTVVALVSSTARVSS